MILRTAILRTASRSIGLIIAAAALSAGVGCATTSEPPMAPPASIGFLSTYNNLDVTGPATLSYIDPNNRLNRYNKFNVLPIDIRMYENSDVTAAELREIKAYFHKAVVKALSQRYEVLTTPTYDAADVKIAVTNLRKSAPILNVIPRPKLTDLGLGGLSMEAEVLDSVSSVQIAAIVESRTGQNRWIDFSQLDDSKAVMDVWAEQFVAMVDKAHGIAVAK